jgi:iron complex transport system ATP-binding protein
MKTALQIENISFSYSAENIFSRLNASFSSEQISVILGKNGSGKSTLLRLMAGIQKPSSGKIFASGKNVALMKSSERAKILGYMPQIRQDAFPFTVEEFVLTGRFAYTSFLPDKDDIQMAAAAMHMAGIDHLSQRLFSELSGGEQQLAATARLLAQDSSVILMDEPTSFLDIHNQAEWTKLVRKIITSGKTIIAVLHDPNLALALSNEIFCLTGGKLIKFEASDSRSAAEFFSAVFSTRLYCIPDGERFVLQTGF